MSYTPMRSAAAIVPPRRDGEQDGLLILRHWASKREAESEQKYIILASDGQICRWPLLGACPAQMVAPDRYPGREHLSFRRGRHVSSGPPSSRRGSRREDKPGPPPCQARLVLPWSRRTDASRIVLFPEKTCRSPVLQGAFAADRALEQGRLRQRPASRKGVCAGSRPGEVADCGFCTRKRPERDAARAEVATPATAAILLEAEQTAPHARMRRAKGRMASDCVGQKGALGQIASHESPHRARFRGNSPPSILILVRPASKPYPLAEKRLRRQRRATGRAGGEKTGESVLQNQRRFDASRQASPWGLGLSHKLATPPRNNSSGES
jgi:hypothetical protein